MDAIEAGFAWLGDAGRRRAAARGLLQSFLDDGLIAGVGSVLVFLPQILILFFFILLLEDLGYMARAAFLMDRIMGGAGLHGRAFIPLLSSFACAIPGIMATRVIDDKRDRLTTILVAPLMTCSARIPVYTLIIARLHSRPRGLGLRRPAGAGDVRPLRRGHRRRAAVSFVIRSACSGAAAGRAVHAGAARPTSCPQLKSVAHRPVDARADLPQARRHASSCR